MASVSLVQVQGTARRGDPVLENVGLQVLDQLVGRQVLARALHGLDEHVGVAVGARYNRSSGKGQPLDGAKGRRILGGPSTPDSRSQLSSKDRFMRVGR